MKQLKRIVILSSLATVLFSCEKENSSTTDLKETDNINNVNGVQESIETNSIEDSQIPIEGPSEELENAPDDIVKVFEAEIDNVDLNSNLSARTTKRYVRKVYYSAKTPELAIGKLEISNYYKRGKFYWLRIKAQVIDKHRFFKPTLQLHNTYVHGGGRSSKIFGNNSVGKSNCGKDVWTKTYFVRFSLKRNTKSIYLDSSILYGNFPASSLGATVRQRVKNLKLLNFI